MVSVTSLPVDVLSSGGTKTKYQSLNEYTDYSLSVTITLYSTFRQHTFVSKVSIHFLF